MHTRDLLDCRGLPSTKGHDARRALERAFRTYGLPRAIRTDNGVPFATCGVHGLSPLNVWWMRLGIARTRAPADPARPARPERGARLAGRERMHRTLKAEACRHPQRTRAAPQRRFDAFRREYNDERPHDA